MTPLNLGKKLLIATIGFVCVVSSASCFAATSDVFVHPSASIVQTSETERGIRIVGEEGIPPNGILFSIPLKRIILADRGRKTPVGRAIAAKLLEGSSSACVDDESDSTYLTLWLCHALHKQRKYELGTGDDDDDDDDQELNKLDYDYLDSLPKDMANLPVFWDEPDLEHLQGSRVRHKAWTKRRDWTHLHHKIDTEYNAHSQWAEKETSLQEFLYARALVETRTFRLRNAHYEDRQEKATERPSALVPFADMLNHQSRSHPTTCDWSFEDGSQAFVIRAPKHRGLKKGEEATQSYGLHSNSHYLSCYGFALEENLRHDGASPDEAHIDLSMDGELLCFAVSIGNKRGSEALFSKLRASVADGGIEGTEDHFTAPYSMQNEQAALMKLRRSVVEAIGRYQTTFQEDEELLRDKEAFPAYSNRRNAILVRAGEKRVLQHWLVLCDAALTFLGDVEQEKKGFSEYCDVLDATLGRFTSL